MQRKLIQLSESTHVVSLPVKWLRENKLSKGDVIDVQQTSDGLLISPVSASKKTRKSIDIAPLEGRLNWMTLDAAYLEGNDIIVISTRDDQSEFLTRMVRYFPGMIIADQRKNEVTFENIGTDQYDVEQIITRIYNMILSFISDGLDACEKKDWDFLARAKYRDYTINSYISLALRRLTLSRAPGAQYAYVKILEMFADKVAQLLQFVGGEKKIPKETFLAELREQFLAIRALATNYSQDDLIVLEKRRSSTVEKTKTLGGLYGAYISELFDLIFELEELLVVLNASD